jgi:hypothetical protein
MMAGSNCSNARPDTLMQDRSPPTLQIFLLRTAGPYIWVIIGHGRMSINVRFTPKSGHRSAQWQCPLCARSANQVRSSISLSARATKVAGISTPIAFAAFRLITNSTELRWPAVVVHLSDQENSRRKVVFAAGCHPVRQPKGARPHLPLLPAERLEKAIRKVSASHGPATRR